MPSASTAEKSVVAPRQTRGKLSDVKCSDCGNPIIKDGQFKCLRCGPHRLVQATLDKQDIVCSRHRSAVVLMRYSQRDGYRVYCQKSGCHNHDAKIGTPILTGEEGMTQGAEGQETVVASKTQGLRDWISAEIDTTQSDVLVLDNALRDKIKGITSVRYEGLTSDEREAKMKEDRQKLEQIKRRLELFKSAQELDVDVDALEQAGIELRRREAHILSFLIEGTLNFVSLNSVGLMSFVLICDTRTLNIFITSPSADVSVRSHHYLKDITSFSVFSQKHESCDTHSIECRHSVDENGNGWLFKVRWTITHSQPHDTVLCSVDHVPFNKK